MRRALLFLAVFFAVPAWADCTTGSPPITFNSEKLTISSTGIGFTAAVFGSAGGGPAVRAYCGVETDSIRFLIQKVPTATTGILVPAGSFFEVCAEDIARALMIRVTADATINCIYGK